MIFDQIKNLPEYKGLGKNYATAIDWLMKQDLKTLAVGKIEIDGKEVFANVQEYETKNTADCKFESHKNYTDIQIVFEGKETIAYAPLDELSGATPYDAEKDMIFYDQTNPGLDIPMKGGEFTLFMPLDGHKPKIANGSICHVKKIILKIKVA